MVKNSRMSEGPTPQPPLDSQPASPLASAPGAPPARASSAGVARLVFALAAAAALAALFWPRQEGPRKVPSGGFLVDAGGTPVPLARELKPATLVHFWATWCAPCVTEIPSLLAYAGEATGERFGLVMVAVEDEPAAARRFLGEARFPLLFDPSWDVAHRFGTRQLPETHLVVAGKVVESFIGATDWGDPQVRATVAARVGAAR